MATSCLPTPSFGIWQDMKHRSRLQIIYFKRTSEPPIIPIGMLRKQKLGGYIMEAENILEKGRDGGEQTH